MARLTSGPFFIAFNQRQAGKASGMRSIIGPQICAVLRLFFDPVWLVVSKEKPRTTHFRASERVIGLTPTNRQLDFSSGISGCWDDSTELSQFFICSKTKDSLESSWGSADWISLIYVNKTSIKRVVTNSTAKPYTNCQRGYGTVTSVSEFQRLFSGDFFHRFVSYTEEWSKKTPWKGSPL